MTRMGVRVGPDEVADAGRHLDLTAIVAVHTTLLQNRTTNPLTKNSGKRRRPGTTREDYLSEERARFCSREDAVRTLKSRRIALESVLEAGQR